MIDVNKGLLARYNYHLHHYNIHFDSEGNDFTISKARIQERVIMGKPNDVPIIFICGVD